MPPIICQYILFFKYNTWIEAKAFLWVAVVVWNIVFESRENRQTTASTVEMIWWPVRLPEFVIGWPLEPIELLADIGYAIVSNGHVLVALQKAVEGIILQGIPLAGIVRLRDTRADQRFTEEWTRFRNSSRGHSRLQSCLCRCDVFASLDTFLDGLRCFLFDKVTCAARDFRGLVAVECAQFLDVFR